MNTDFYCFGEMLWDCLPSGRHAGGAPLNVAAHLAQLGASAFLLSAVGQDPLGDEILKLAGNKGIDTRFVSRARPALATGTVQVILDADANATYEVVQPVAWDEIDLPSEAAEGVAEARAIVFGSLAARSAHNLAQLDRLLVIPGPLKFFDINLRPPFVDPERIVSLARRADVIKLNDGELGQLSSWIKIGAMTTDTPSGEATLAEACATLAAATGVPRVCVTRAAAGAALWDHGVLVSVAAPRVTVKDTVGAGDAFMAGLVLGLTRQIAPRTVLEVACELGAYVASQEGATPPLPAEIIRRITETFGTSPLADGSRLIR